MSFVVKLNIWLNNEQKGFFGLELEKQVGRLQVGYKGQERRSFLIKRTYPHQYVYQVYYAPTPIKRNALSLQKTCTALQSISRMTLPDLIKCPT